MSTCPVWDGNTFYNCTRLFMTNSVNYCYHTGVRDGLGSDATPGTYYTRAPYVRLFSLIRRPPRWSCGTFIEKNTIHLIIGSNNVIVIIAAVIIVLYSRRVVTLRRASNEQSGFLNARILACGNLCDNYYRRYCYC